MKKTLYTILLIFITLNCFGQWQQVGNTLQRTPDGFSYRFSLGSPGYFFPARKSYVDSLFSLHPATIFATSPLFYNPTTGLFTIQQGNGSQNGYLSSVDWNTFNSKASSAALTAETSRATAAEGANYNSIALRQLKTISTLPTPTSNRPAAGDSIPMALMKDVKRQDSIAAAVGTNTSNIAPKKKIWADSLSFSGSNYGISGGGATVNPTNIVLNNSTASINTSISRTQPTFLINWQDEIEFTVTANGGGFRFGHLTTQAFAANFDCSASGTRGQLTLLTNISNTELIVATSTTNLSFTNGDKMRAVWMQNGYATLVTVFNLTTGAQVSLLFNTFQTVEAFYHSQSPGMYGDAKITVTKWGYYTYNRPAVIYVYGDSITKGYASNFPESAFSYFLINSLRTIGYVNGRSAATSSDIVAALPELLALHPQYVMVVIGINDAGASVSTGTYIANITTIVNTLVAAGITPIICGPTSSSNSTTNTNVNAYNTALTSTFGGQYQVINLNNITGYLATLVDQVHPNENGHDLIYQTIRAGLKGFFTFKDSYDLYGNAANPLVFRMTNQNAAGRPDLRLQGQSSTTDILSYEDSYIPVGGGGAGAIFNKKTVISNSNISGNGGGIALITTGPVVQGTTGGDMNTNTGMFDLGGAGNGIFRVSSTLNSAGFLSQRISTSYSNGYYLGAAGTISGTNPEIVFGQTVGGAATAAGIFNYNGTSNTFFQTFNTDNSVSFPNNISGNTTWTGGVLTFTNTGAGVVLTPTSSAATFFKVNNNLGTQRFAAGWDPTGDAFFLSNSSQEIITAASGANPAIGINGITTFTNTVSSNPSPNIASFLAPNTPTNGALGTGPFNAIGVAISTNNAIAIQFTYAGAGSASNFGNLGLYGVGGPFSWNSTKVSIGSSTFTSLFNVGTSAQFQVNSSGAIVAATGVVSSGTITFSALGAGIGHYSSGGVLSSSLVQSADLASSLALTTPNIGVATGTSLALTGLNTSANSYNTSAAPSGVVNANAGTGATVSIVGNNQEGVITLTTGTGVAAGDQVTVTMSGGFAYPSKCNAILFSNNSAALGVISNVLCSSTATTWTITTASALSASVIYVWRYHNGGY